MFPMIDCILLLLCLIFAVVAAKRGFTASALAFIFSLIGASASWATASHFCDAAYRAFVRERLMAYLSGRLIPQITATANATVAEFFAAIPAWILSAAKRLGVIGDTAALPDMGAALTAETLEASFFGPLALFIVKTIIFIVVSVLLGIIFKIIAHAVRERIRNSAAHGLDIALGAAFGFLRGAIVSLVVSLALYAAAYLAPQSAFANYVDASFFCRMSVEILNIM